MEYLTVEYVSIVLFFIGLYGMAARRNVVKTILSLGIMDAAVILYFLSAGPTDGRQAPIGVIPPERMVDPFPQAMMITAIVIGISVTAVQLTLFITMYHRYGTTNWVRAARARLREYEDA